MAAHFPQNEVGINRMIQQDWANREYIEIITGSIKKIADFLNSFDRSCRGRLALLNEKLTNLERTIEFLEAKVSKENGNNLINQNVPANAPGVNNQTKQ